MRKNIFAILVVVPLRSFEMAAEQGRESFFSPSLRRGSTAQWPWVMLCSLAVFNLSSDPPGVSLECLKLLNVFLNGPFPHHKEGCGDKSDL